MQDEIAALKRRYSISAARQQGFFTRHSIGHMVLRDEEDKLIFAGSNVATTSDTVSFTVSVERRQRTASKSWHGMVEPQDGAYGTYR